MRLLLDHGQQNPKWVLRHLHILRVCKLCVLHKIYSCFRWKLWLHWPRKPAENIIKTAIKSGHNATVIWCRQTTLHWFSCNQNITELGGGLCKFSRNLISLSFADESKIGPADSEQFHFQCSAWHRHKSIAIGEIVRILIYNIITLLDNPNYKFGWVKLILYWIIALFLGPNNDLPIRMKWKSVRL